MCALHSECGVALPRGALRGPCGASVCVNCRAAWSSYVCGACTCSLRAPVLFSWRSLVGGLKHPPNTTCGARVAQERGAWYDCSDLQRARSNSQWLLRAADWRAASTTPPMCGRQRPATSHRRHMMRPVTDVHRDGHVACCLFSVLCCHLCAFPFAYAARNGACLNHAASLAIFRIWPMAQGRPVAGQRPLSETYVYRHA